MSDENGSAQARFQTHAIVEVVLLLVLLAYMGLAQSRMVGDDFAFTVVGAALMALVTYWTLSTLRDGLEVIAIRVDRSKH
ncbi:hypothetical protein DIT71_05195 [Marinobacter vulgaris]|uniref:Uncharacterized protein n=1 Tax=Marinobacter vulgaris TaxID=1928331 RepID=A0A2V3ZQV4_9GAMM|nr:hypothetical protein [Marinobacter vulgaris]PXX92587.1 hypothetical protein DIT71_05195 [Marinobacter vulgaris]TSJ71469.1 hypothetical protein FPC41_04270 [Marinobacter vulgaris]